MIIKTNNWSIVNTHVSKLDYNPSYDDALESSKDWKSLEFLSHKEEIESSVGYDETLDKDHTIQLNEATRHLELYIKAWKKIHKFEGPTEIVTNCNDGSITWKVVKEVTDDGLTVAQE